MLVSTLSLNSAPVEDVKSCLCESRRIEHLLLWQFRWNRGGPRAAGAERLKFEGEAVEGVPRLRYFNIGSRSPWEERSCLFGRQCRWLWRLAAW